MAYWHLWERYTRSQSTADNAAYTQLLYTHNPANCLGETELRYIQQCSY